MEVINIYFKKNIKILKKEVAELYFAFVYLDITKYLESSYYRFIKHRTLFSINIFR